MKNPFQITDAKGQAVIEAVFLLPFMIAFFMFIYQSYIILNKAQIAQKALRASVIRSALTRYDTQSVNQNLVGTNTNPNGSFAFEYIDPQSQGVKYSIGTVTGGLILVFASKEQYNKLNELFSNFYSPMKLGICTGGDGVMKQSVSPEVLNRSGGAPWTCNN